MLDKTPINDLLASTEYNGAKELLCEQLTLNFFSGQ
jgi:hypothetical protein